MRSLIICDLRLLTGDKIKEVEVGGTFSMLEKDDKLVQNFNQKKWREDIIWETK